MTSTPKEIVLTASPDGPIFAYDPSSSSTLAHFTGSQSPRRGLALAGKSLIAASHISPTTGSGSIHLYNWWSSTAHRHLPLQEPIAPLAATSDGSYLFAGGLSGNLHVIELPSGNIIKSFTAHSKPITCLEITDDGSFLISGGDDGVIVVSTIFKLITPTSLNNENLEDFIFHRFAAHDAPVTAINCGGAVTGSNSTIISCSLDCTCKFWSLCNGTRLRKLIFPCAILGLVLDPMEQEFYAGGSDGFVYNGSLYVTSKQQDEKKQGCSELVRLNEKHNGAIMALAVTNHGQNLISASEDGRVCVWDIEQQQVVNVLGDRMAGISHMVVAKQLDDGNGHGGRLGGGGGDVGTYYDYGGCQTFGGISSPMGGGGGGGEAELGGVLSVVAKDRRKAVDMLESAIGMYEKLLELILKEANRSSSSKRERIKRRNE